MYPRAIVVDNVAALDHHIIHDAEHLGVQIVEPLGLLAHSHMAVLAGAKAAKVFGRFGRHIVEQFKNDPSRCLSSDLKV